MPELLHLSNAQMNVCFYMNCTEELPTALALSLAFYVELGGLIWVLRILCIGSVLGALSICTGFLGCLCPWLGFLFLQAHAVAASERACAKSFLSFPY